MKGERASDEFFDPTGSKIRGGTAHDPDPKGIIMRQGIGTQRTKRTPLPVAPFIMQHDGGKREEFDRDSLIF